MTTRLITVAAMAALLGSGCMLGKPNAVPLYAADAAHRLPPEQVATLHGPIHTVDGRDVSGQGRSFELTPGCHVVVLSNNVGQGTTDGAWAANIGRLTVAFRMRPMNKYIVDLDIQDSSAPVGRMTIRAREVTPDGQKSGVPFARSSADVEDCHQWAQRNGY